MVKGMEISYSVCELKRLRSLYESTRSRVIIMYDIACLLAHHLKCSSLESLLEVLMLSYPYSILFLWAQGIMPGVTLKAKFARAEPLLQDVSAKLEELAEKLPGLILPSGTNHMSACSSCLKNPGILGVEVPPTKFMLYISEYLSFSKVINLVKGEIPTYPFEKGWPSNCHKARKADQQSREVHPQNFVRSKWVSSQGCTPNSLLRILNFLFDAKDPRSSICSEFQEEGDTVPALVRRQIIDLFCLHNRCQEELELLKEEMNRLVSFLQNEIRLIDESVDALLPH
ncbi:hypothetical protein AWC38_SpisGene11304 [Stylophora pistillata]|uniref:Uncharacterized protein n=1 Tax=Stylophora pistillata TaxID=50429 RepID=A0A2B4S4W8_STYPI|nr:hypothetical protein AWC38_SpisGene11304 [Stylophora pistillata]